MSRAGTLSCPITTSSCGCSNTSRLHAPVEPPGSTRAVSHQTTQLTQRKNAARGSAEAKLGEKGVAAICSSATTGCRATVPVGAPHDHPDPRPSRAMPSRAGGRAERRILVGERAIASRANYRAPRKNERLPPYRRKPPCRIGAMISSCLREELDALNIPICALLGASASYITALRRALMRKH